MNTSSEARVKAIMIDRLGVEGNQVRSETLLADDLVADPLDMIELMMAFEEAFAIEIPEEDQDHLRSIRDVVNYVQGKTGAA